jgi:hypothetical protein
MKLQREINGVPNRGAQRLVELQRLSRLATVVTIGAVSSLSIPMLTLVTAQTMTEEIMAIQIAAVLLLSLAAVHLTRATVRYRFVTLSPRCSRGPLSVRPKTF